jgi:hypothetical protein
MSVDRNQVSDVGIQYTYIYIYEYEYIYEYIHDYIYMNIYIHKYFLFISIVLFDIIYPELTQLLISSPFAL